MKVEYINIPDINKDNLDESKLNFADSVINQIYPKFESEASKKQDELIQVRRKIKKDSKEINNKKSKLQKLMSEIERKKKVIKLINRVERIISAGAIRDGSLRHEMITTLKVCEKMGEENLDRNLERTKTILQKRYSEV